jgi:acyl-CoA thioester hydrolase
MTDLLAGFPVIIEQVVDWGDMDSFRHVNNAVYFRYFENARVEYFQRLDWMNYLKETGIGPIVATAQARFRRPVTYPDTLLVGTRVSTMSEDRYTVDYRVVSRKQDDVVTLGDTVVVTYHYAELKKVPIPTEFRSRIEKLEGKRFE